MNDVAAISPLADNNAEYQIIEYVQSVCDACVCVLCGWCVRMRRCETWVANINLTWCDDGQTKQQKKKE